MSKYDLILYLFCVKKSFQTRFYNKMVTANDLEKKVMLDLVHYNNAQYGVKEVVRICNEFNKKYKQKHSNNYLCKYHGEQLLIEGERYNKEKAFVFDRYTKLYYMNNGRCKHG